MAQRSDLVVVAGLTGAASVATPGVAQALSLSETIDATFATPTAALVAGAVGGAALTGATLATVALVARARRRAAEEVPVIARHLRAPEPVPVEREAGRRAPTSGGAEGTATADAPHRPGHAATNYEQIAQNYVNRASFRARMARRAEGVAATLRERMGANMMEGMPVIERADGSVGDVGTSWWRNAVGEESIIRDSGFAEDAGEMSIPSDFSETDRDRLVANVRRNAGSIASRIAYVDEGAYPERRSVEDLSSSEDAWASALSALDEKIASVAPPQDPIGFIDGVGGIDSLDEPDNLEPQTAFIPFKTPGGHPEVVDTESYVDYLIEDEFSKNSSTAVRRSSRRFLRLLEGGTQPTSRHLADTDPSPVPVRGKHFSMPRAAEA